MTIPKSMKGVVLTSPYKVQVQDQPAPSVQQEGDVVIKVHLAGICGSDLHCYRFHEDLGDPYVPFIMGHEAVGTVVAVGKGVKKWKEGDVVVSPFSLSCGCCFYCSKSYTARCTSQILIGSPSYPGAQAEYLRIAMADSSLFGLPEGLDEELGLMMCDILPTGYSTAINARRLADEDRDLDSVQGGGEGKRGVCVVIGCGPVGLCAITSATTLFEKVYATDLQPHRLEAAVRHGATAALPFDELKAAVLEATGGRGADAVLEMVGHAGATLSALDIVRPYGAVSVGGVHSREIKMPGGKLYDKNVRLQFGRCSVRTFFEPAMEVLKANQKLFEGFVEHRIGWSEVPEYYKLFEKNQIGKTVIVADKA